MPPPTEHGPEWRARVEQLFDAALDLPTQERAAFVASAAGSAALRSAVEALLEAHAREDGPLDGGVDRFADGLDGLAEALEEATPERRIGPYRVLRELGRGGMGVVYLAERDDGQYRRRVAVKLLRGGPDAQELSRRFRAERQILASLNHPGIAQLLDGGVTDGRIPYLVMEYVDGRPIDRHCDLHRLDIPARLRLFQEICGAVHHAHQNLVIHRDLKPGNILVTAEGRVKLLDFGIAKLLNPDLAPEDVPVTRAELRVMTPEYASPEQVRGDPLTTASDVYALGVVLYQLLAGHSPHRLTGRTPAEVTRLVCEEDPEPPSVRVVRSEWVSERDGTQREVPPSAVAEARDTVPERLARLLRGDLDDIALMALRKEPGRRYGSAVHFAQDVQRYLTGMPVMAHRETAGYRLGKFLRRHRFEAVAAALVAVSLVSGAGLAAWQAAAAGREQDRAEAALAQAEGVTRFLMELFEWGEGGPAPDVTARELLARGASRADALADRPAVQAGMLDVIGRMQFSLGRHEEASRTLERAVSTWRTALGSDAPELASSLLNLAQVRRSSGALEEARALVEEALDIRRRILPAGHPDVAVALTELGWLAPLEEQERLYREALEMLRAVEAHPDRQVSLLRGLATNMRRQGRYPEALASDREAVRVAEALLGPEDARTGGAMIHLADQVRDLEGDLEEAEALYRRGLALMAARYGEDHISLLHGYGSLAELLARRDEGEEAERLLRRVIDIQVASTGEDHPASLLQAIGLAEELARQGRLREASELASGAVARLLASLGPGHPWSFAARPRLARILFLAGQQEEAGALFRASLERVPPGRGPQVIQAAEFRRLWGRLLVGAGRFGEAEPLLLESLETLSAAYGGRDHPNVEDGRRALMELYRAWDKPEREALYRVPPGSFVAY